MVKEFIGSTKLLGAREIYNSTVLDLDAEGLG